MEAPPRPFKKPSRKPREEPPGLDAFAAGVPGAVVLGPPNESPQGPPATSADTAPESPTPAASDRELHGMNVRFTTAEKAALQRLAEAESRSQHQIIKRLLKPALEAALRALDAAS